MPVDSARAEADGTSDDGRSGPSAARGSDTYERERRSHTRLIWSSAMHTGVTAVLEYGAAASLIELGSSICVRSCTTERSSVSLSTMQNYPRAA